MKPVSCFAFQLFLFERFAVGSLQGTPHRASSCRDTESESYECQRVTRVELLVQPPSGEKTDQDAQREFETDSRVGSDAFPAIVHRYCKKRGAQVARNGDRGQCGDGYVRMRARSRATIFVTATRRREIEPVRGSAAPEFVAANPHQS